MRLIVVIVLGILVAGAIGYGIFLTLTTPWEEWDEMSDDNDD